MRRLWPLLVILLGCEPDPGPSPSASPSAAPPRAAPDARPRRPRAPSAPPAPPASPTPSPAPPPSLEPVPPLRLEVDPARAIENRVELTIRPADLRRLERPKERFRLSFPDVVINGEPRPHSEVKLRGQTSLRFPRKALNVKLSGKVVLRRGAKRKRLKRFTMSGLVTDRGYFRAAVSLDLLRALGRFPLFTSFAELRINGRSFGTYLLVERPVDGLLKRGDAALIVRRRGEGLDDDPDLAPERTDLSGRALLDRWEALLARVRAARGPERVAALERGLDLPGLLTWLAFDLLVHNSDEGQAWVVAYPRGRRDVRFDLLPWDYDLAFHERVPVAWPRPWLLRYLTPEKQVGDDPVVFARYRARLRELSAWAQGPEVRAAFEAVFQELAPYYASPEVIANAKRDRGGPVDLPALRRLMNEAYAALVRRARRFERGS